MNAPVLKPKFVTDENGERVAVILSMAEYEEISDLLEDLADAVEIERRRGERGIPHEAVMQLMRIKGTIPD